MNANELADALDWVCENHLIGIGDADFKSTATMLRKQQAEIEALKAGKIRAYDNGVEDGRKPDTHPVKELTDEEIWEVVNLKWWDWEDSFDVTGFAKAILRKAQEKCTK
jgi:hypothetical protein